MGFWNDIFPRPEPKPAPKKELPKEFLGKGMIVEWKYEHSDFGVTASIGVKMDAGTGVATFPVSMDQLTEIQKLMETDGVTRVGVVFLPEEFD